MSPLRPSAENPSEEVLLHHGQSSTEIVGSETVRRHFLAKHDTGTQLTSGQASKNLNVQDEKIHETPSSSSVSTADTIALRTPLLSLPTLGLATDKASAKKTEPDRDGGTDDYQELPYLSWTPIG